MSDPLDPRSYITPQLIGALALIAVFFQALRLWRPAAVRVETRRRRAVRVVSALLFIGLTGMSLLNAGSTVEVISAAAAGPSVTLTKDTTARFAAAGHLSTDVAVRFTTNVAAGANRTPTVADTSGLSVGMRLRIEDGANDEWIVLTAVTATSVTADFNFAHTAPYVGGTGAAVVKIAGAITASALAQTVAVNNTANVVVGTVLKVDNGAAAEYVTVTAFTATTVTAIFAKNHVADTAATRARLSFDSNSVALRADATNTAGETTLVRATFTGTLPIFGKGSHAIEGPNGLYLVPHGFTGTSCKATWSLFDSRTNSYSAGSPNLTSATCSGSFSIKTAADTFLVIAGGRLTATTTDASATPLNTVRVRTASLATTAAVTATGSQTVAVSNTNNIAVGTQLRIDSGARAETVTVTAFSAGVSITATFAQTHAAGVSAAGFTIAAGPALTATTGAGVGAHAIKRTDGNVLVVHGGGTADTSFVTAGSAPTIGAGPVGTTSCTDPGTSTCSLAAALGTGIVVGDGALSIPRPDGLSFGLAAGGAVASAKKTFLYHQATSPGGFTLGTDTPGGATENRPGAGAHAIQFNDASAGSALRYRVLLGDASTLTASYDPSGVATTTTLVAVTGAGNIPTGNVGAGTFSIRRADGSFLTFHGNALTTTSTFSATANPPQFAAGPTSPAAIGAGAHGVQLEDGDYLVRVGGATGSAVTAFYDGGYRLSGQYTTEPLNPGNVDQWTTVRWTKNADLTLTIRVRSATTSAGLATAAYTDYATTTALTGTQSLALAVPNKWVQLQAVFSRPIPASSNAQESVWLGSGWISYDRPQTMAAPTLSKLELDYTTGELVITGGATQTAGVSFTPTVALRDSADAVVIDYTGAHTLIFTGAVAAPNGTVPTVNATAFGTGTPVTFTTGSATPAMLLYRAEGPIIISASEVTGTGSTTTYGLTSVTIPTRLVPEGRFSVTVGAGASATANSTITRSLTSLPADDATTSLLTITLKDAFQNNASGRTPTLTASVAATFSAPAPTDPAGVTTATVRSGRATVQTITASEGPASLPTTIDFRPTVITVTPGLPPQGATANVAFNLQLTARGNDTVAATNFSGVRSIGFASNATRRTAPVNRMGPTIPTTLSVTFDAAGAGTTSSSFILTNAVELPTITALAASEYRSLTITPAVTRSFTAQTVAVSNTTYVVPGTRLLVDSGGSPEVVQVTAVITTVTGSCPSASCITAVFLKSHSAGVSATGGAQGTSAAITVQVAADDSLVVFARYVDFTLTNAVTGSPTAQTVQVSNTTNVNIGLTIVLVVEDLSALETSTVTAVPSSTSITAVFLQNHAAGTRVRKGDIFMNTLQAITKGVAPQAVSVDNTANVVVGSRIFVGSGTAAELVQVTAVDPGISITGIFVKDHALNTRVVQGEVQTANVAFSAHLVLIDIAGNPVAGLAGSKTVTFTWNATQRPLKTLVPAITGHPTNEQTIEVNDTAGLSTNAAFPTELNVDTAANGEMVSVTAVNTVTAGCPSGKCVLGIFKKSHAAGTLTIPGLAPVITPTQTMTFNAGEADAPSTFTFTNRSETPTLSATLTFGVNTFTGTSSAQTIQTNVVDPATSELTVIPTSGANPAGCLFDACVNADGIQTATWTVRVYDVAKNPLESRTVVLTSDRGVTDTITQPVGATDTAGIASGTIRSTAPGNATIQASARPRNPASNFLLPLDTSQPAITMTRIVRFGGSHFVLTLRPGAGAPEPPAVSLTITGPIATGQQTVSVSNTTGVVVGRGMHVTSAENTEIIVVQQIIPTAATGCATPPCLKAVFAKTHTTTITGKAYTSVNAGIAVALHIVFVDEFDAPVTTYSGEKTISFGTSATARALPDLGPAASIPTPQTVTFTAAQGDAPSQFTLFNAGETPVVNATQGGAFLGLTPPLTVNPQAAALGAALTITPAITANVAAQTVAVTGSLTNVLIGTRLVIESGTLNKELVTVTAVVTTVTGPCPSASCITAIFTKSHAAGVKARYGTMLSALPTSAAADGVATSTITATVTDQFHNPRSGFTVTINTDGTLSPSSEALTPSAGATSPAVGTSNAAGQFVATAISKTVRTATYNVTISGGTGGATGLCAAVTTVVWTLATNSTDHFSITYQSQVTDFTITPAITASGSAQTVTVSNTANFIGPVSFTITPAITASGTPQTVAVDNTAGFAPGDRLVIDSGVAKETITVTATTATSLTAVFAQSHAAGLVVQMGADQLVIDSAGNQETITLTGKTATSITAIFTKSHVAGLRVVNTQAGATFGFVVTARKPNDDPDTNYCTTTCTIRFTHTATVLGAFVPEPLSPTDLAVTFVSGVYTTSATLGKLYRIEESVTFNVVDNTNGANGTTVPIRGRPAPADPNASYVFAFRRTAPADDTTEVKLWARATDPFGNAVSQTFAFSALRADGTTAGLRLDGDLCAGPPCSASRVTDSAPATGTAASPVLLRSSEPGMVIVSGTMSGIAIRSTEVTFTTPGALTLVGTYWGEVNNGTVVKYPLELTPFGDCKPPHTCDADFPGYKQGQPLPFSATTSVVWRVFTKNGVGAPGSGDFDNPASGVPFGPTVSTSKSYCGYAGCESLSEANDHKTALLVLKAGHLCVTAEWQNPDATPTVVDIVGTTNKDVSGLPTSCIQSPSNIVGAGVYEVTSTVDATTTRARVIWDGSPNDPDGLMRVLSWWTTP